jgi:hypothetical protein
MRVMGKVVESKDLVTKTGDFGLRVSPNPVSSNAYVRPELLLVGPRIGGKANASTSGLAQG